MMMIAPLEWRAPLHQLAGAKPIGTLIAARLLVTLGAVLASSELWKR